jgi:hypothetical protein
MDAILQKVRQRVSSLKEIKEVLALSGFAMLVLWASFSTIALLDREYGAFQRAGTFGIAAAILSAYAARSHFQRLSDEHRELKVELDTFETNLRNLGISFDSADDHIGSWTIIKKEFSQKMMELQQGAEKHPELADKVLRLKQDYDGLSEVIDEKILSAEHTFDIRDRFLKMLKKEKKVVERIGINEVLTVSIATLQTGYGDILAKTLLEAI